VAGRLDRHGGVGWWGGGGQRPTAQHRAARRCPAAGWSRAAGAMEASGGAWLVYGRPYRRAPYGRPYGRAPYGRFSGSDFFLFLEIFLSFSEKKIQIFFYEADNFSS
jgi:hypothetical protein